MEIYVISCTEGFAQNETVGHFATEEKAQEALDWAGANGKLGYGEYVIFNETLDPDYTKLVW